MTLDYISEINSQEDYKMKIMLERASQPTQKMAFGPVSS